MWNVPAGPTGRASKCLCSLTSCNLTMLGCDSDIMMRHSLSHMAMADFALLAAVRSHCGNSNGRQRRRRQPYQNCTHDVFGGNYLELDRDSSAESKGWRQPATPPRRHFRPGAVVAVRAETAENGVPVRATRSATAIARLAPEGTPTAR